MNKSITFCFLLALCMMAPLLGIAGVVQGETQKLLRSEISPKAEDLFNLDRKDLEAKIGRKLKLKEKIVLKLIELRLKKQTKKTPEEAKTDSMAILGFSISVASLLLGINLFIFLSIFGGLLGILFSSIALKRIKRQRVPRKGKGLAVAGLVTGIVVAGAWLIFILGFLLAFA